MRARVWLALCVALGGLINVTEALLPKSFDVLNWMEHFLPFHVSERSRMLLLIAGFLQLALSRGLFRGKRAAWGLCLVLFASSPLLHLGRAFDWHHAAVQLLLVCALIRWRKDFLARSDGPSLRWAFVVGFGAFALLLAFGVAGLTHFAPEIRGASVDWLSNVRPALSLIFTQQAGDLVPFTHRAAAVCRIVSDSSLFFGMIVVFLLLKPILPRTSQTDAESELAARLIARHGRDSLDPFALLPDKRFHFHGEGEQMCVTAFALWRDIAVTLSAPIGPPESLAAAIVDFTAYCERQDWQPVFYEVPEGLAPAFRAAGLRTFHISEEACLDLKTFSLAGKKFQNLRTAVNKMKKASWKCQRYRGQELPEPLRKSLEQISDAWLASRHSVEMTFDLGSFSPHSLDPAEIFVLFDDEDTPIAFASWLSYGDARSRSLDLVRHGPDHRGVMDMLIVESLLDFQRRGLAQASLGSAPLANVDDPSLDCAEEKAMRYLFERFDRFYGYKSLFDFKKKFDPQWRGRDIAYRGIAYLVPAVTAIVNVHLPKGLLKYLRS